MNLTTSKRSNFPLNASNELISHSSNELISHSSNELSHFASLTLLTNSYLILLTTSERSLSSSNASQSSNTPHSNELSHLTLKRSNFPLNASQQLKKLSKTLTFSFTLRKLYDIIVLVNQQKLTFDSKRINTSLILTLLYSNEFKRSNHFYNASLF